MGLPAGEAALILALRPADSRHSERLIRHAAAEATLGWGGAGGVQFWGVFPFFLAVAAAHLLFFYVGRHAHINAHACALFFFLFCECIGGKQKVIRRLCLFVFFWFFLQRRFIIYSRTGVRVCELRHCGRSSGSERLNSQRWWVDWVLHCSRATTHNQLHYNACHLFSIEVDYHVFFHA